MKLSGNWKEYSLKKWISKTFLFAAGLGALVWFLIRVIPKPSRASYPCQRAAFPLASAFVIWLTGVISSLLGFRYLKNVFANHRLAVICLSAISFAVITIWFSVFPSNILSISAATSDTTFKPAIGFDWQPGPSNQPIGEAKGIFPGRVVMVRDPEAAKWSGKWNVNDDQWWLDKNTDIEKVYGMLSATLQKLTGETQVKESWDKIFKYYNQNSRGLANRGYKPGESIIIKINLNNSSTSKVDNQIDATPQMVLAMVRQLVNVAGVEQKDIIICDARRPVYPYMLTCIWKEFKDVRFLQEKAPVNDQPVNPAYGDYTGLESADWVEGVTYSAGNFKNAKLIPRQIKDATYLINLALLKLHSYPYNYMEDGDEGQTALTMNGKNHAGSIKGTSELHSILNTKKEGKKNAYSPLVDLAASPNLGGKTILYLLDGLYCGRKWRSYPSHFPNPPFNNKVVPYENPEWPSCVLASFDGVALQSVGLDIMYAQSKNNNEASYHNVPRILIRENADDFLREMAIPEKAPSGTKYIQDGKPVKSLGVFEHWNNDDNMQYSRNLDPVKGKGIEFIYMLIQSSNISTPKEIPGNGISRFNFIYAGEGRGLNIYKIEGGKVTWNYSHPAGKGEISDAVLLPNKNILIARQYGISEISPEKQIVWNYDAPEGTEIHTAQPVGKKHIIFLQNGKPAQLIVMEKSTKKIVKSLELQVGNPNKVHGHFRNARLTKRGTIVVSHLDMGKVREYDSNGKILREIEAPGVWAAQEIPNGNLLISMNKGVQEIDKAGKVVWKFLYSSIPEYSFTSAQRALRLANGNTIINNWKNVPEDATNLAPENTPIQAIEVTPDKKVVWALRAWSEPANLGPSTTIIPLDEPYMDGKGSFGKFK